MQEYINYGGTCVLRTLGALKVRTLEALCLFRQEVGATSLKMMEVKN